MKDIEFFASAGAKAANEANKMVKALNRKVADWQRKVYAAH